MFCCFCLYIRQTRGWHFYFCSIVPVRYSESTQTNRRHHLSTHTDTFINATTFHADVDYLESLWQRRPVGSVDLPLIDIGQGEALVFVPILQHLEFVYARQIRALSRTRRVTLYRRRETRNTPVGLAERAEELRQ